MTLIETAGNNYYGPDLENNGTIKVENSEWRLNFIVSSNISRVDFYHGDEHSFSLIRWKKDSHIQKNSIGVDVNVNKDKGTWLKNTMPGELLAAGINILYNREER